MLDEISFNFMLLEEVNKFRVFLRCIPSKEHGLKYAIFVHCLNTASTHVFGGLMNLHFPSKRKCFFLEVQQFADFSSNYSIRFDSSVRKRNATRLEAE